MKTIPKMIELDEDDIRDAIKLYLDHNVDDSVDYKISLSVETKTVPAGLGGRDYAENQIITAHAEVIED